MNDQPTVPLRDPAKIMRLARLGSLHQCRLSFMRILTRRMAKEGWVFTRPIFQIDAKGVGHAVYTAKAPNHSYSLIAFAHDLPDRLRSDRVIAEAWDATFTLFDGIATAGDLERLSNNVPLQEAGRVSGRELSLSRANRSVRLWSHVVESLSEGRQPDLGMIRQVGYLMRTTAVYGSGKFGAADRDMIADRVEMQPPFQAEMLSVYLTRAFVCDLVQHMASVKGGAKVVQLDPAIARQLGIGNSTGLGMAPYIINHPKIFNNWILARETAIARVRSCKTASAQEVALFHEVLESSELLHSNWHSTHPIQTGKLAQLGHDLSLLKSRIASSDLTRDFPWNRLMGWAEAALAEEGQELVASLILEPYPDLVDELAPSMADTSPHAFAIDGTMPVSRVRHLIEQNFAWALDIDWQAPQNCARLWYVSQEKLEPRLGERSEEHIGDYEQPLAIARDQAACYRALDGWQADQPIAAFLLVHPEHRHIIRRAQISLNAPYSEIRDNTISADMLPIDMLRAKLAFFGAIHFDPRSDRWVRICMYSNAPYPQDLNMSNADRWIYPAACR
ncbi:MAG: hypothetical protein AAF418_01680 [Pseudomonadota bacterium]